MDWLLEPFNNGSAGGCVSILLVIIAARLVWVYGLNR